MGLGLEPAPAAFVSLLGNVFRVTVVAEVLELKRLLELYERKFLTPDVDTTDVATCCLVVVTGGNCYKSSILEFILLSKFIDEPLSRFYLKEFINRGCYLICVLGVI